MEKEANNILNQFKQDKITLDKARLMLFVLVGVRKSATCKFDRIENECSIYLNTNGKCDGCGQNC